MKIGSMGKLADACTLKKAVYDRMELDLREISALSDGQFEEYRRELLDTGLEFAACSWILPLDLDMTSPDFKKEDWHDHLAKGADRCSSLGVRMWPFGTGKGRSIKPGNGDEASQKARVAEFLAYIDSIISKRGITSVIEPLGPANSNYIATLSEADEVRKSIGSGSIWLMCDLRHMVWSHDSYENIAKFGDKILHCHIDYPQGDKRIFPTRGDGFDYHPYLEEVAKLDCGSLTFEAIHSENTEENLTAAIQYIKSMF